jgi:hypothetical protein
MRDRLDCDIYDADLLAEIELTVDLMLAASESPGPLSVKAIDCILGLARPDSDSAPSRRPADWPSAADAALHPPKRAGPALLVCACGLALRHPVAWLQQALEEVP